MSTRAMLKPAPQIAASNRGAKEFEDIAERIFRQESCEDSCVQCLLEDDLDIQAA